MADLAKGQTHIVLVNAVVEKDGRILISRRSFGESHEPGRWSIPGGKVDRTEGNVWNIIEKTLHREILEETGIEINNDVVLLSNNTFIRSTGHHVIMLLFLCHWKSGEARPLEDTIDIKWISEEDINDFEYPPNVKAYIKKGFEVLKFKNI